MNTKDNSLQVLYSLRMGMLLDDKKHSDKKKEKEKTRRHLSRFFVASVLITLSKIFSSACTKGCRKGLQYPNFD